MAGQPNTPATDGSTNYDDIIKTFGEIMEVQRQILQRLPATPTKVIEGLQGKRSIKVNVHAEILEKETLRPKTIAKFKRNATPTNPHSHIVCHRCDQPGHVKKDCRLLLNLCQACRSSVYSTTDCPRGVNNQVGASRSRKKRRKQRMESPKITVRPTQTTAFKKTTTPTTNRFRVVCFHCNRRGHIEKGCRVCGAPDRAVKDCSRRANKDMVASGSTQQRTSEIVTEGDEASDQGTKRDV